MTAIDRRQSLRAWPPPAPPRFRGCRAAPGPSRACRSSPSPWAWPAAYGALAGAVDAAGRRGGGGFPSLPLEAGPVTVRWERTTRASRASRSGQACSPARAGARRARGAGRPGAGSLVPLPLHGRRRRQHLRPRPHAAGARRPSRGGCGARLRLLPALEHGRPCRLAAFGRRAGPDLVLARRRLHLRIPVPATPAQRVPGGWVTDSASRTPAPRRAQERPGPAGRARVRPWLVTWDDHEVQNDYAGLTPGNTGPEVADFVACRGAAYQAYYEHMPPPASVLTRAGWAG